MRRPDTIEHLYLDFDGFFASVEQQLNPRLRGRPIGIVPYEGGTTCIIACSREAKAAGVKNIMMVDEARRVCPDLLLIPQQPAMYRRAHNALVAEIDSVVPVDVVKSIDELACQLDEGQRQDPEGLSARIKAGIAENIGPHITCSIGFAANRHLAKIACAIDKPNGLTIWHPADTRNAAFNRMIDEIEHVAIRSRAPLLLMGPTGAGKSQLARRIFDLKRLKHQTAGAFVEVNCATLKGDSAMSALFGHKKGAFTGAVADRPGLLRSANNGMLFLDEIGELGLDEQAMILRAIEDKRFLPVGADSEVASDFQLIAGTNRNLAEAVAQGRFRDDLYARLNLWTFTLPGLADRREDIEPNLDYELDRYAEREGNRITFNKEARERYLNYATSAGASWPGNFRDLAGSVTRMAIFANNGRIDQGCVDGEIARLQMAWGASEVFKDESLASLLSPEALAEIDPFDRVQLSESIRICKISRNLSEAGRTLFSASRSRRKSANDADRLRKYLARFELDWNTVIS
jgi:DNA-binding NtrC family response regulator